MPVCLLRSKKYMQEAMTQKVKTKTDRKSRAAEENYDLV